MEGARLARVPSFSLRQRARQKSPGQNCLVSRHLSRNQTVLPRRLLSGPLDDQAELSVGGTSDLFTSPTPWHLAGCQEMPARDRAGSHRATFSGH